MADAKIEWAAVARGVLEKAATEYRGLIAVRTPDPARPTLLSPVRFALTHQCAWRWGASGSGLPVRLTQHDREVLAGGQGVGMVFAEDPFLVDE